MPNVPYKWRLMIAVPLAIFMVILDGVAVSVALPSIMNDFNVGLDRGQLVISMFFLGMALGMPLTGYLGDRLGTKRLYILCVAGFTLGSALCGIAWDFNAFIFFRVIQSLTGGIAIPPGMALIFRTVPREEQGFMIALTAIPIGMAPIIGPILSGYLVETASWRLIFYVYVPAGTLSVLLASWLLRETERVKTLPFDYKGWILVGIAFTTGLLALTRVPEDGWTGTTVVVMFAVAVTALVAWIAVELTEESPLLDLRIFRIPTYTQGVIVYLVSTLMRYLALFLLPQCLRNVRGLGPMDTGLLIMPAGAAEAVALPIAGRLYDKMGPRPVIMAGFLGLGYSMFRLHSLDVTTSDADLVKILLLQGASMGMMALPAYTVALSVFSPAEVSRASAVTMVLRQLTPAFGTAVFATMLQTRQAFHFSNLAQTVTPDSLTVVQVLSRLKDAAGRFGARTNPYRFRRLHGGRVTPRRFPRLSRGRQPPESPSSNRRARNGIRGCNRPMRGSRRSS